MDKAVLDAIRQRNEFIGIGSSAIRMTKEKGRLLSREKEI